MPQCCGAGYRTAETHLQCAPLRNKNGAGEDMQNYKAVLHAA